MELSPIKILDVYSYSVYYYYYLTPGPSRILECVHIKRIYVVKRLSKSSIFIQALITTYFGDHYGLVLITYYYPHKPNVYA